MGEGKIAKIDDIYFYSLAVKEAGIIDFYLPNIKDEVMKIQPVQKQTSAGQRMKFKAYVIVGDFDGHVGLGVKGAKEVATYPWCHRPRQALPRARAPWILGKQSWTSPHRALQGDRKVWLCAHASHPCSPWNRTCRFPCLQACASVRRSRGRVHRHPRSHLYHG